MSKLLQGSHHELEAIRLKAMSYFAPLLLQDTLLRIRRTGSNENLEKCERAMLDLIEYSNLDDPDFDDMKEFAAELVHICIREVISTPDVVAATENIEGRRTPGRSEKTETLEEQLQEGLEGSFPASDPPAVVSTTISGKAKKLVGTDEVLAQKRKK